MNANREKAEGAGYQEGANDGYGDNQAGKIGQIYEDAASIDDAFSQRFDAIRNSGNNINDISNEWNDFIKYVDHTVDTSGQPNLQKAFNESWLPSVDGNKWKANDFKELFGSIVHLTSETTDSPRESKG